MHLFSHNYEHIITVEPVVLLNIFGNPTLFGVISSSYSKAFRLLFCYIMALSIQRKKCSYAGNISYPYPVFVFPVC